MRDIDIDVEYRELTQLDDDWANLPKNFMPRVAKRVSRGCLNIKRDWKDRWEGHDHIPHLPDAISYDVTRKPDWVGGEVGPDKHRRQGPLGNIIEFGTLNNPPIPGGVPALELEEPKFVDALADLGERAPVDRRLG
jgi:hypothetical protein